ncbi:thioredoxin [Stachybotrys elegans]|uniref:Thioredoxin n=1 Tax=Stachybotrys elegans TaxID=80388 RepID=A0A8K0SWG5_9HYPO|nr:thioredoxin [Stachybotrys elegans]
MAAARSLLSATVLGRMARAPSVTMARQFHATSRRQVVHHIKSQAEFAEALKESTVIVDFFATWCGPCKAISPFLTKMSDEAQNQGIKFLKLDVDELPELTAELGVRAMPTFMVFQNGKKVDEMMGAHIPGLQNMVEKHRP